MPTQTQFKPITIIGDPKFSNPAKGIAPHPLDGIGLIRNLDIKTNPGSVRLNNVAVKKTGTMITGNAFGMCLDPIHGNLFACDDTKQVYKSADNGETWTVIGDGTGANGASKTNNSGNSSGGGCEVWKDYLFVSGATSANALNIDVYGPISSPSGTPWYNSWKTVDITGGNAQTVPFFKSIDGKLYIGGGKYVNSVAEAVAPFAPGTTASFSWNAGGSTGVITLADNYIVSSFEDLGSNLMVGTINLGSSQFNTADIFPYSRSSLTLGIPIQIKEYGIRAMKVYANRLYIVAGVNGKLFVSDTVTASEIAQIPNYAINLDGGSTTAGSQILTYFSAMMIYRGKVCWGVSIATGLGGNGGVWAYDIANKTLVLENTISTGDDGTANGFDVLSLLPITNNQYLIAWQNNGHGIDKINNTSRYTAAGYAGYIDSPLIKIGQALANTTAPQLEINLVKPLVTGQGVKIQYRKDLTSAFTTLATADFATYGGYQSLNVSAAVMTNLVFLQIRVLLTTASASNLSPELQSILLVNPT